MWICYISVVGNLLSLGTLNIWAQNPNKLINFVVLAQNISNVGYSRNLSANLELSTAHRLPTTVMKKK